MNPTKAIDVEYECLQAEFGIGHKLRLIYYIQTTCANGSLLLVLC